MHKPSASRASYAVGALTQISTACPRITTKVDVGSVVPSVQIVPISSNALQSPMLASIANMDSVRFRRMDAGIIETAGSVEIALTTYVLPNPQGHVRQPFVIGIERAA